MIKWCYGSSLQRTINLLLSAFTQAAAAVVGGTSTTQPSSTEAVRVQSTPVATSLPAVLAGLPIGQQYELLKTVGGDLVAVPPPADKTTEVRRACLPHFCKHTFTFVARNRSRGLRIDLQAQ